MKKVTKYHRIIELDFESSDFEGDTRDIMHDLAVSFRTDIDSRRFIGDTIVYFNAGSSLRIPEEFVRILPKDTEKDIYDKLCLLFDE